MSTQSADALGRLWSTHINDVLNASSGGQELFNAAAFQLAIWKLVYDTSGTDDTDLTSTINTLHVSLYGSPPSSWTGTMNESTLNSTATTWANDAWDGTGAGANLIALTSPDFQDQITSVPSPASLAGGAALLAAMGIVHLRRRSWLVRG